MISRNKVITRSLRVEVRQEFLGTTKIEDLGVTPGGPIRVSLSVVFLYVVEIYGT